MAKKGKKYNTYYVLIIGRKICNNYNRHYTTKEDKYWDELNLDLDPEHAVQVWFQFLVCGVFKMQLTNLSYK